MLSHLDIHTPTMLVIIGAVAMAAVLADGNNEDLSTFRGLFQRQSNKRLSAIMAKYISNTTVDRCTDYCVKEIEFQCRSFDYDNSQRSCLLFTVNLDDTDVHVIESKGKDHYETSYVKVFNRLPSHRLPVHTNRPVGGVSMEGCARHCVLESYFKCRGFNYRHKDMRCMLIEATPATSTGAIFAAGIDYFERMPDGAIAEFINYGMGRMQPLAHQSVHQSVMRGGTLTECATTCLSNPTFDCRSFDYVFEGVDSICYLSKYIAANVGGLVIDASNVQHNHFEKIGPHLQYFYATPYSVIPGNNLKSYTRVTPDKCAEYCSLEESFVCRSFDYRIEDAACMLSDKAGSDVGGLVTQGGFEGDVHHFEMKPILDCGGNLTSSEGNLASPNWPRDYAHHESCSWHITTTQYKVLHIHFTYFELGLQSADPCSEQDDRLVMTDGEQQYCILPNTKDLHTKTPDVSLTFYTNGFVDAQGFRMFYTAEWTCNENLDQPGEFASPKWPNSYPSGSRCSWKVTAPLDHRIHLTFTSFELEQHQLGHCNEKYDHVRILDGGTVNSPLVGLYCGSLEPFVVRSTGQDMFIQFISDNDPENTRQGFHASYTFEMRNDTTFDGVLAGPGYKSLDEGREEEVSDGLNTLEGDDAKAGETGAHAAGGEDEAMIPLSQHTRYKKSMWAVVTVLLIMLVAAGVVMYLMYRHYRVHHYDQLEIIHQDGVMIPMATQPTPTSNICEIKPNNDADNQPGPSGAEGGAVGGQLTNNLALGKYAKENMKNINLDTKNFDDEYA